MNGKKIVFFDIDGTIWDYEGRIPASVKPAIDKLKENGHIPVICTGRAKGHVRDERLMNMGFDGIIAACGAHVEYKGEILFEQFMPQSWIEKIAKMSIGCNVPIVFEGKQKYWISANGFKHDDFVARMIEVMGEDAVIFQDYSDEIVANKFSGDILLSSKYEEFCEALSSEISFITHELGTAPGINQAKHGEDPYRITGVFEAVIPGTSKAQGMKVICDYLKMDMKDTFAIGDSNNDIEMVNAAGVGIAMGNASKNLKETADYITQDLEDDGVYKAREHFKLL